MGLSEDIVAALRERYRTGSTFAELGKDAGVSLSYLHDLTIGKRDPMKLSLDFFLRLFPSAQISLASSAVSSPACSSIELERVRMEAERDRLAHERRELELERRIFELEKELAERPRTPRDESPEHPYRVEHAPSTLSPSNK